jgi:hypothetical protein
MLTTEQIVPAAVAIYGTGYLPQRERVESRTFQIAEIAANQIL